MGKRLQGIIIGAVIGVLVASGVAYAVTTVPPSPTDRFYACVSATGTVESSTMRLNKKPSVTACANDADTIRSWGADSAIFARVAGDATITAGSHAVSASRTMGTSSYSYKVTFDRDISKCAYAVNPGTLFASSVTGDPTSLNILGKIAAPTSFQVTVTC